MPFCRNLAGFCFHPPGVEREAVFHLRHFDLQHAVFGSSTASARLVREEQ